MIVKDLRNKGYSSYGKLLSVYAFYWLEGKLYFMCSPEGYEGLIVYSDSEVEITDGCLGNDMILVEVGSGDKIIVHKHLCQNNLMDRLSEYEPEAYKEFVSLLGCEP